jgi:hypothetical protein
MELFEGRGCRGSGCGAVLLDASFDLAVSDAGAELVRFARSVGLVRGDIVAVDGSKFQAVSSAHRVRERDAVKRYLEQLDTADAQDEMVVDPSAVQAALEKLKNDPEPEARFMRTAKGSVPAYNVQTARRY